MRLADRARRRRESTVAPGLAGESAAAANANDLEAGAGDAPPPAATNRRSRPRSSDWDQPALTAELMGVKRGIHSLLVSRHAEQIDLANRGQLQSLILRLIDQHQLTDPSNPLSSLDRDLLVDALFDEILGLGPLEGLIRDVSVTEIMVNGHAEIWVERDGEITLTGLSFDTRQDLMVVIDRIVSTVGRRVDESSPMVDARLADGSRVNVIIPPVAIGRPVVTIRKFARDPLSADQLIEAGAVSRPMMDYLKACVEARLNILISGGTGSGKTTLLNMLSGFIPARERIVTAEDAAELRLQQKHVVSLETKPANVEGRGAVTIRDLVRNSLRMRPDRIVVGEVRGGEALDMLQAMNTGHDGSMSTLHANTPADAIDRLETMVLMAGLDLPSRAVRSQIASAVHVIVQTARLRGGVRRIVAISELDGVEAGEIRLRNVFEYVQVNVSEAGRAEGYHTATRAGTGLIDHFAANGITLPASHFVPAPALRSPARATPTRRRGSAPA